MASDVAISYKSGKIKLVHGFAVFDKMGGGIHVGAVVGTHGKGGEVDDVAIGHGAELFAPRCRVAGIDGTGKEGLGDVVDHN